MHTGWSRRVLLALMNETPYLVDLFVRIPCIEAPSQTQCLLSLQDGQPSLLIPSPLPPLEQLIREISHHLLHLVLEHPFLSRELHHDSSWQLALDLLVDQQAPTAWRRFGTATIPVFNPDQPASLLQMWTWFVRHPEAAHANQLEAIREHRWWHSGTSTPIIRSMSSILEKIVLPAAMRRLQADHHDLAEALLWRKHLANRAASSASTRLTWTHHRPSRRYGSYPGVRIRSRGELVVVMDTSGSMAPEDLHAFFGFLPYMSRSYDRIILVEADHQVRAIYPYTHQPVREITGRGDTFFQPALDTILRTRRPDAIWYVTDGQGTPPRYVAPIPLTWLICGDHATEQHLAQFPGNYLFMKNKPTPIGVSLL